MPFDPISTLLAAALFAPAVPTNVRFPEQTQRARSGSARTDNPLLAHAPATSKLFETGASPMLDLRDAIFRQLDEYATYSAGWDGPDSEAPTMEAIGAAKSFIDAMPGGLELPVPMLSATGEVGFYWNAEGGYADISFDAAGLGSFFSRNLQGTESFLEAIQVGELTRDWFFQALGEVCSPVRMAA